MVRLNADGEHVVSTPQLGGYTVVFDRKRNLQVMRVQGVIVLPVGAEIELMDPAINAKIVGIRLLAGGEDVAAHVCLDVEVPSEYWDKQGEA